MSFFEFCLDPNVVNDAIFTPNSDDNVNPAEDNNVIEPPDLSKAERIDLAFQAWKDANGQLSMRRAARIFGVSWTTLQGRIKGACPKAQASQAMQRLSVAEEDAIRDWLLELSSWGWPIRIERLRAMAIELLANKGDTADLGVHWTEQFLHRYPQLRSKFVAGLDKERADAQDPEIFHHWFELYRTTVRKYNIKLRNCYNMDEKGVMMGYIGKVKVIISKQEKKIYMTQPGNREWVSLIECISVDGRRTRPWVIFKAKQHQKAWFSALPDAHIAVSVNGWTDNELGLEWIEKCFEPETRCGDEYRLLLLDGHASHITTKVIRFCVESKIIPLCLPPHTTHLLQPLDVGVFSPLATAYKAGVRERSKYLVSYSIDKIDFLEIYGAARNKAITPTNVKKSWKAVGLEPWDPGLVLKQLPDRPSARPNTPPSITTRKGPTGISVEVPFTPLNVAQVERLLKTIVESQSQLNAEVMLGIQKLSKGASKAIANASIQRTTNVDLITAELTRKKRSNRQKNKNYAYGRVLNEEIIQEREAYCKFQDVWRDLSRIQPNLLGEPRKKTARKRTAQVEDVDDGVQEDPSTQPSTQRAQPKVSEQPQAKKPRKNRCSICRSFDHNARTCPSRNNTAMPPM
jgi:hypothetical protein